MTPYEQGIAAYKAGEPRHVPRDLLLLGGPEVGASDRAEAKAWYRGWVAANLADDSWEDQ